MLSAHGAPRSVLINAKVLLNLELKFLLGNFGERKSRLGTVMPLNKGFSEERKQIKISYLKKSSSMREMIEKKPSLLKQCSFSFVLD